MSIIFAFAYSKIVIHISIVDISFCYLHRIISDADGYYSFEFSSLFGAIKK